MLIEFKKFCYKFKSVPNLLSLFVLLRKSRCYDNRLNDLWSLTQRTEPQIQTWYILDAPPIHTWCIFDTLDILLIYTWHTTYIHCDTLNTSMIHLIHLWYIFDTLLICIWYTWHTFDVHLIRWEWGLRHHFLLESLGFLYFDKFLTIELNYLGVVKSIPF